MEFTGRGRGVGSSTDRNRLIRYAGRMQERMETPVAVDRLEEVFKSIVDHAGTKIIFGEPVTVEGKTILPIGRVRYGFGGGSGRKGNGEQHGGGGGGGLVAKPVGVVEITQSETRFIPISSKWSLIAAVALGVCLGLLIVPTHNVERN